MLKIFSENCLTGVGLGNWHLAYLYYKGLDQEWEYYLHNDVFQFVTEVGLVGFAFLLIPFIYNFSKNYLLMPGYIGIFSINAITIFFLMILDFSFHSQATFITFCYYLLTVRNLKL